MSEFDDEFVPLTQTRPVPGTEHAPEHERQFFGTFPPRDDWEYTDATQITDPDFRWIRVCRKPPREPASRTLSDGRIWFDDNGEWAR